MNNACTIKVSLPQLLSLIMIQCVCPRIVKVTDNNIDTSYFVHNLSIFCNLQIRYVLQYGPRNGKQLLAVPQLTSACSEGAYLHLNGNFTHNIFLNLITQKHRHTSLSNKINLKLVNHKIYNLFFKRICSVALQGKLQYSFCLLFKDIASR